MSILSSKMAVVAHEVKKLAEQSMDAAREIANLVTNTQKQTAITVQRAVAANAILESQNKAVMGTTAVFENIYISMKSLMNQINLVISGISEMEGNKDQTVMVIQNISAVSEETTASSEEATASAQEQLALSNLAQNLKETFQKLDESITQTSHIRV